MEANPAFLTDLGLFHDSDARVLICFRDDCKLALSPKASRVTTHLRDKHGVPEEARKGLTRFLRQIPGAHLRDPEEATPRVDGSPEHKILSVHKGFSCTKCPFRTISLQSMRRHFSHSSTSLCPANGTVHSRRAIDDLFEYVYLQTWASGPNRRYWVIERDGRVIRESVGEGVQAHYGSVYVRELERRSDRTSERAAEGSSTRQLSFAEQRPWMDRTGWDITYKQLDQRETLAMLISMPNPSSNQGLPLRHKATSGCTMDHSACSPATDERKISSILKIFDALMDKCEETVRKTSRSLLCWLRSTQPSSTYSKPFALVHHSSSTLKYRLLMKRCIVMVLRLYRMPPEQRERLVGPRMSPKQLKYAEMLWYSVPSTDIPPNKYRAEETGVDIAAEDNEETSSDEDESDFGDGNPDAATDNEQADTSHMNGDYELTEENAEKGEEEPSLLDESSDQTIDESLQLLFGLLLSLCTQPLVDGQPSSTLLIFYSGVLSFHSDPDTFASAKSYTPHLSGLIYILRLLLLEYALPTRSYPLLDIACRPKRHQGERIGTIRRRYMVMGSQSAFEELISLRNYGRVIARSDAPAFLLRWTEDNQRVSLGGTISITMGEFRLLPEYFINEAERLCHELMFEWDPEIDLNNVQDDLTNEHAGYSFVSHKSNDLETAYLQLLHKACSARRGGLVSRTAWDWNSVFRYLSKEEAFREFLLGCFDLTGGQKPRCAEILSIYCVNGSCGPRGIYVYNGSLMYLVRHHKAKRTSNHEFIVARFLPAQVGYVLYKYLVYIRPFVELLHRERASETNTTARMSPLLFRLEAGAESKPWPTGRLTSVLKRGSSKVWNIQVNSQQLRQICIGITEKHVREIYEPFNRFDDKTERARRNVVFAWQSGHRPLQRGTTYGLDGAFPTKLQPQLLELYRWASTKWHEFLHLPSCMAHTPVKNERSKLGSSVAKQTPVSTDRQTARRSMSLASIMNSTPASSTSQSKTQHYAAAQSHQNQVSVDKQSSLRPLAFSDASIFNGKERPLPTRLGKRTSWLTESVKDVGSSTKRQMTDRGLRASTVYDDNVYRETDELRIRDYQPHQVGFDTLFGHPSDLQSSSVIRDRQAIIDFWRSRRDLNIDSAATRSLISRIGEDLRRWRAVGCQFCFVTSRERRLDHDITVCTLPGVERAHALLDWLETLRLRRYSSDKVGICSLCGPTNEFCQEMTVGYNICTSETEEKKKHWRRMQEAATQLDGLCNNKEGVRRSIAALCTSNDSVLSRALVKVVSDKDGVDLSIETQAAMWFNREIPYKTFLVPQILLSFQLLTSAFEFLTNRQNGDGAEETSNKADDLELEYTSWGADEEVDSWKAAADLWSGKCAFCAGNGLRGTAIQHALVACQAGGKPTMKLELGEAIYREGFFAQGGCERCAMPRKLCNAWTLEDHGRWRFSSTSRCQYGRVVYDTIIGVFYCKNRSFRFELLKALQDEGLARPTDEDVAAWLSQRVKAGDSEGSNFIRQLQIWTQKVQRMSGSLEFDSFERLTDVEQGDIDDAVSSAGGIGEIKQVDEENAMSRMMQMHQDQQRRFREQERRVIEEDEERNKRLRVSIL